MTDTLATPRFLLPLLATAQAQKEMTHNEALTLIDALIQPSAEAGPQADPPSAPDSGTCWLVADDAVGAWSGRDNMLAIWTGGGWRFVRGREGMRVWRKADGMWLRFEYGQWVVPANFEAPEGGAVIDSEARAAINALILLLRAQGLVISA